MANLKNTSIANKESAVQLPTGNTSDRPTTAENGYLRFNTDLQEVEYFADNNWYSLDNRIDLQVSNSAKISWTSENEKDFRTYIFESSGSITVNKPGYIEYLCIAGGGGSGGGGSTGYHGGGGGGGGFLQGSVFLTPGTYSVVVGSGGSGGFQSGDSSGPGSNGGDSSIGSEIVAVGGGGGGGQGQDGRDGGSGGGGGLYNSQGGSGIPGQGFDGGQAQSSFGSGGAGGGAGGPGGDGDNNIGGDGGPGKASSIIGSLVYYAGGGGAAGNSTNGISGPGGAPAYNKGINGFGMGGGGRQSVPGLPGGDGIVVIRHEDIPTKPQPDNSAPVNYSIVANYNAANHESYKYYENPSNWQSLSNNDITLNLNNIDFSGEAGGALVFNGSSSYADVTSDRLIVEQEITCEAWIYMNSIPDYGGNRGPCILIKNGATQSYEFGILPDGKLFKTEEESGGADHPLSSNETLQSGQWYHVAFANDTSTARLFINGLQDPNTESVNYLRDAGSGEFRIGTGISGGYFSGTRYFDGLISVVRIYNKALTEQELQHNFVTEKSRYGL